MTTTPKGLWHQKKRLATGEVAFYGYFGRGPGMIPLGRKGTPDYYERLAEALRKEPQKGTLHNLIWQYRQSTDFAKLAPRTRHDYVSLLDKIQTKFGTLSYRALEAKEIIPHFFKWRDEMAQSPKRANYAITVLKLLLSWAVKRGHLNHNRAAGIDKLAEGDRREKSWSKADIDKFIAKAPEPLQRAMILAVETGQRQADLLALPWSGVKDGKVSLRQKKTGVYVSVPVSPALQACLDKAPRGTSVTVLTRADGLPWDPKGNGFRSAWRAVCEDAGIADLTFHDLRGTFITNRLSQGWEPQQVALCAGHSLRNMAMLDIYADRRKVADAHADRIINAAKETLS